MFINIFTTQISYLLMYWITGIQRCFDSGCDADGKTTKKNSRNLYYKLYIGNEFDIGSRYSEVRLKTIFRLFLL
jgi:hypothetical protein